LLKVMSASQIRLKLLRAVERFLRGWADHLSSMTSEPPTEARPPKDWLDRVKRAGHMVGHTASMPVDLSPGVEDDAGALQTSVRSSDLALENREVLSNTSVVSSAPTASPSAAAAPRWRRPLKLRPPLYPPPQLRDIPAQTRPEPTSDSGLPTDSSWRSFQPETPANSAEFPAGPDSPMKVGVVWPRRPLPRTEPAVEFSRTAPTDAEHDIHYPDVGERESGTTSWNSLSTAQHATKVNYGRLSRSAEPVTEFRSTKPPLSVGVEFTQPIAIPAPAELELPRSRKGVQGLPSLDWRETPREGWPQLPEESASQQNGDIRMERLLEDRSRIDREQNGRTWNARRF